MSDDDHDLERLLGDAFSARARDAVGDGTTPPPPRYAVSDRLNRHRRRWLAPLAAAAAVIAVAGAATGITYALDNGSGHTVAGRPPTVQTRPATPTASPPASGAPVHIKLLNADGDEYGVGMPVIAFFSKKITNATALQQATVVTVDGQRKQGAWYFESSSYYKNYPIEGHLRLQSYWPAHATIRVDIPAQGLSAGKGLAYDDDLSLEFTTGPKNVATVNDVTHKLTLTTDGKPAGVYPVSLGAKATPTSRGIKVIMEKGVSICMSGPGYDECGIKYTQRLTYGGEYLHSAPWNMFNIENGVDSSNGCTNLAPADAAKLYNLLRVGDVVQYPNADGPQMQLGMGYGDWNVNWGQWQTGGLVPTH